MDVNYIVLAIPVFFFLIGIEVLFSKLRQTNYYRLNDAVTNLSCGIGQQVVGIFLKTATFIGYQFIYANYRVFDMPQTFLMWFLLFIGVDFFYYWFHRYAHEISFLWGSHIVHHQSEEYNFTVALRQAWLQGAFSWFFYLPLAVVGFDPIMFVTISAFQTLYQFWIHTQTIHNLPQPVELILNTPSHHRVHHGVNPKYIDRNMGGTLIIWDRIFGTFQPEDEEVVYGVKDQPKSWNPLWLNFHYWIELFRDLPKASNWADRWRMLVKQPGWRPPELGGVDPPKEVTPDTFPKYDTKVPEGLNYYVLVQYALILLGTSGFLFLADHFNTLVKLGSAALIILSIVNLGGIFEKRRWVAYLEYFRLLVFSASIVLFFRESAFLIPVTGFALFLMVASAYWFFQFWHIFTKPAHVIPDED